TDMLPRNPDSAICVQRFDDSLNFAIRTTYRTLLRSSSIREPRDPPLKRFACAKNTKHIVNDPSAGSPTETLLRLLLPLDDQV
ncbi:putative uncharacterized protein ART3, partial [Trichoplax sp. H2]